MDEPLDRAQWASRNTGSLSLRRSRRQLFETLVGAVLLYWAYQRFWPGQQMQAVVEFVSALIAAYLIVPLGEYAINVWRAPSLKLQRRVIELETKVAQLERAPQHQGEAIALHLAHLHAEGAEIKGRIIKQALHWDGTLKPVAKEWDVKVTAYLQKNAMHMLGRYKAEHFEGVDWFADIQIGARTKQWAKYMETRLNNLQSIIEKVHG
jgi:hypothetical protein